MPKSLALVVISMLAMVMAIPKPAHATDATVQISALLNKTLPDVRRTLVGDRPTDDQEALSAFKTATANVEAFGRFDLLQSPGCQAYIWPNEMPGDYNFVFVNKNLHTIKQLIVPVLIHKDQRGASYRPTPRSMLRQNEDLPLESGPSTYVDSLISTSSPSDKDVKVHCDPKSEAVNPVNIYKPDDNDIFSSLRIGMTLDARVFANAHRGLVDVFESDHGRYAVICITKRIPFPQNLKVGAPYEFVGVRDGRVEWTATGAFAGGVAVGLCSKPNKSEALRRQCSSDGVFHP